MNNLQLSPKKIDFLFHEPPAEYSRRYPDFLYNRDQYVQLFCPSGAQRLKYYLVDHKEKTLLGFVQFMLIQDQQHQKKMAVSPFKAPFGSFVLAEEVTEELLDDFVKFTVRQLSREGVNEIQIKHYVQAYSKYQSNLVREILKGHDFGIVETWPNHHIRIDTPDIMDKTGSGAILHKEKCRVRKCKKEGFQFQKLSFNYLDVVYEFIDNCRKEKNQDLSLSFNHLKKLVHHFPENYYLFAVFDGDKIISTIITVQVNAKAMYYFLPAYDIAYKSFSPTVLLIAGIYRYCYEKGIEVLDMGLSNTFPLASFKRHMGGIEDEKLTFGRKL